MPLAELGRWVIAALLTGLLAQAAVIDIRFRKIPNRTVLAILVLFVPWAVMSPLPWVLWALAAGAIAFALSLALWSFGVVGAGDSKLFTAVALFVGLAGLPRFGLGTALVGGVVAAVSLLARPHRAMVMLSLRGKGDFGRGIPYGVAIATAGATLVWIDCLGISVPWLAP